MMNKWSVLVLAALVVASAGLAQTSAGHGLLRDIGLSQTPASYTELAFTDPQALPTQLGSEHAAINMSFGIHNVSDSSRTYRWSIELVRSGRSSLKAAGVVSTPAYGRATVDKTVTTSCAGGRLEVVADLASPAESIDLWLTCAPRSGSTR
jgi:hypothetical protein